MNDKPNASPLASKYGSQVIDGHEWNDCTPYSQSEPRPHIPRAFITLYGAGEITIPAGTRLRLPVPPGSLQRESPNNHIVTMRTGMEMAIMGGMFRVTRITRDEMTLTARPGTRIKPIL